MGNCAALAMASLLIGRDDPFTPDRNGFNYLSMVKSPITRCKLLVFESKKQTFDLIGLSKGSFVATAQIADELIAFAA